MQTILWLMRYIRYRKRNFIGGVSLLLVASFAGLYSPIVAKTVIDTVITPASQTGQLDWATLIMWVSGYFLLNVLSYGSSYSGRLLLKVMSNQLVKQMRDELFEHVQILPIQYFDSLPAGKVVSRITNDTEVVRSSFFEGGASTFLSSIIMMAGTFIAVFLLNAYLGLVLLVLIPIVGAWQWLYSSLASRYNLALRESVSEMNGQLNEAVQGMTMIQAFEQESRFAKEYEETASQWVSQGSKALFLDSFLSWGLVALLRNVTLLLVVMYLSMQFLGGTLGLTAGTIYAFIDYINRLFDPIEAFMNVVSNFQQAIAAGTRVKEMMDMPSEPNGTAQFEMAAGSVSFEDVSFAYDGEHLVLHDVSFEVEPGQTVAFVGHTGSGKSSIMNLLFRFYDPLKGTIRIDGQDVSTFDRRSVRESMGIVLQDPYLFTGTLADNIGMDHPTVTREQMAQALRQVGGEAILERGLDYIVKEKGMEFSSGERQLISFARALSFNPKILILDEATSHVDTETESLIQQAMTVVAKGRTTFMIAHRLSTIVHANQILVLDQGRIVERGTHEQLLQQQGVYAEMYRMQKEQPEQTE